jgi:hypothetical protein
MEYVDFEGNELVVLFLVVLGVYKEGKEMK